jgi:hypothetical protein
VAEKNGTEKFTKRKRCWKSDSFDGQRSPLGGRHWRELIDTDVLIDYPQRRDTKSPKATGLAANGGPAA